HRYAFGCVTGGFHETQNDPADFDLVAVAHCPVRKSDAGLRAKNNFGPGALGELAVAADKIRVQVRFDHIFDLEILSSSFLDVLIHVALRIDHHRFTFRSDEVGSMRQTSEIELL